MFPKYGTPAGVIMFFSASNDAKITPRTKKVITILQLFYRRNFLNFWTYLIGQVSRNVQFENVPGEAISGFYVSVFTGVNHRKRGTLQHHGNE